MKMPGKRLFGALAVAFLASTCLAFGSWFHTSSDRKTDVILAFSTKFKNGDVLPAGEYQMDVAKNSQIPNVKFYKIYTDPYTSETQVGNKVMATVKAKVVTEDQKNPTTEVVTDKHRNGQMMKSVRPAGWEEKLVFGS